MKVAIGILLGIIAFILAFLYGCLIVAKRADEEMERNFKADMGEPYE